MADDTATVCVDKDNAATLVQPFCFVEFECKSEPAISLVNSADDDLSTFDALHIPVTIPTIKDPIVLLERCDKIWETLKLIKTIQIEKPTALTDCEDEVQAALTDCKDEVPTVLTDCEDEMSTSLTDCEDEGRMALNDCEDEGPTALTNCKDKGEKKEKEAEDSVEVKQSPLYIKSRRNDNITPFKFSVLKTRRLYPCATCGKQYLERRSLRKHSERVHGVVLPLLKQRKRWRRKPTVSNKRNEAATVASSSKESNSSPEKLDDNKELCEKIITRTRSTSTVSTSPTTLVQFVKCPLCQQKVTSLRKHLVNYHKIGGSLSMVKQLETSLLNETKSENGRPTLKNEPHQDGGYHLMDNESNTREKSQVKKRKAPYTSYGKAKKKFKSSNKRDAFIQSPPAVTQNQISTNLNRSYKCDICLGIYASERGLYKHNRVHRLRGETKENFHKFKCRYFNSPLNKKNRLFTKAEASRILANAATRNTTNSVNENDSLESNDSNTSFKQIPTFNRTTRYSERMRKNNETTCKCGRLFRNPHTLFIHKKNCELYQIEDDTDENTSVNNDKDSGIGINITIKKRNDSYEIVGKDDEDKSETSESSNLKEDKQGKEDLSISHTLKGTKDFTKASTGQQASDIRELSELSKYSKDHSILKLQDIDEDIIIDIEDDMQIFSNEDNTTKQMIAQEDDKLDSSEQQNDAVDGKTRKIFNKVTTLKEMCREVLERKSKNVEDEKKKYKIKDEETCKENSQETLQENKRELRSKRYQSGYFKVELDHSYGTKIDMIQLDPLTCGYCKKLFSTIKLYESHQCTVKRGKSLEEYSLQLLCFCCKEVLQNFNEFDEHVRTKHFDRVYHCYFCPERFTNYKARLYHFRTEHNDLACRFCNKKISISAKAFHEAYHLGLGYPCHKCKRAYTSNTKLYHHRQMIHSSWSDNLTTCTVCLRCVKLKTFRRHMAKHKNNACHFCGKRFSDRVGLEYHAMMHHGTNAKLKCNVCGTRFHTKKQLELHEKVDGCNNGIQ